MSRRNHERPPPDHVVGCAFVARDADVVGVDQPQVDARPLGGRDDLAGLGPAPAPSTVSKNRSHDGAAGLP